jgi:hypothetical protein
MEQCPTRQAPSTEAEEPKIGEDRTSVGHIVNWIPQQICFLEESKVLMTGQWKEDMKAR